MILMKLTNDSFKEGIYTAMVEIEKLCAAMLTAATLVALSPTPTYHGI